MVPKLMLVSGTAAGFALWHLDLLDHYEVGVDPALDQEVCAHVAEAIHDLPWITGMPVRGLLWGSGCLVYARRRKTLDRLEADERNRWVVRLMRLPLVPMLDKLIVTVTYLRAFDAQPLPGSGPD